MKPYSIVIIFILSLFSISSFAQKTGGLHFSYVANFNMYYLNAHDNYSTPITGSIDMKSTYRTPDMFPDQHMEAYQFGFLNHKKKWHDFRFSFIYMPETEKEYTEIKIENGDWLSLGNHNLTKNMELYMMNLTHIYKIYLFPKFISLNIGFGGGGGVIRWPSYNSEGSDMYFLSYYAYPVGGIEFHLGKHLSIAGEYHYQYGNSLSQSESVTGGDIKWDYHIEGHEVSLGLNLYF